MLIAKVELLNHKMKELKIKSSTCKLDLKVDIL